jgi:hypothetical protein
MEEAGKDIFKAETVEMQEAGNDPYMMNRGHVEAGKDLCMAE